MPRFSHKDELDWQRELLPSNRNASKCDSSQPSLAALHIGDKLVMAFVVLVLQQH
jgi:hypothetical protein